MALAIGKFLSSKLLGEGLGIIKKLVKDKDLAAKLESDFKVLSKNLEIDADKLTLEKFKAEVSDRERATGLYKSNDTLQKTFAIVFLVGYILVTFLVMYGAYKMTLTDMVFNNETVAIVTMLFTAMSNKINTIVDFLFGGSASKKN